MPFPCSVGIVSDNLGFDYFLNAELRYTTSFEILEYPILIQPISTLKQINTAIEKIEFRCDNLIKS